MTGVTWSTGLGKGSRTFGQGPTGTRGCDGKERPRDELGEGIYHVGRKRRDHERRIPSTMSEEVKNVMGKKRVTGDAQKSCRGSGQGASIKPGDVQG